MQPRTVKGLAVTGVATALVAAWAAWGEVGLFAAGLIAVLGGLGAVGRLGIESLRRANRRATEFHRDLSRQFDTAAGRLEEIAGDSVSLIRMADENRAQLESLVEHVNSLQSEATVRLESLMEQVSSLHIEFAGSTSELASLRTHFEREMRKVDRARRDEFSQIDALIGLYRTLDGSPSLVGTRGWAASPDILLYLYSAVRALSPGLAVECGSGMSTVVMAYAARAAGNSRIVALEHKSVYADATTALLVQHGLTEWAEVRLAPLESIAFEGEQRPWYRLDSIPDEPISLLFVDGPPADIHEMARLPAFPMMEDRLESHAIVVLDDYHRPDERRVVERWIQSFPGWVTEVLDHEKGTAVLRRAAAD